MDERGRISWVEGLIILCGGERDWSFCLGERGKESVSRRHIILLPNGPLRESSIRGCPDGRTIPSAGLLDYEDTRLKTSSRVRMGLSLAWKASLAMRIFRSPTIVTDFV